MTGRSDGGGSGIWHLASGIGDGDGDGDDDEMNPIVDPAESFISKERQ